MKGERTKRTRHVNQRYKIRHGAKSRGKKNNTAYLADIEIISAEDLSRDRTKVVFHAKLARNPSAIEDIEATWNCVWDPRRGDGYAMISVARKAGCHVERTDGGYKFETAHLVGAKVSGCAVLRDKKAGRVRLWHPEELKKMQESGEIASPKLL